MATANPLWGAPRIHGELCKLGLDVSERTVSRLVGRRRPPSQTWRTFLANHMAAMVSMDFFTVSTLTGRVLFVLVLLSHERRRVVHINVTDHPTSTWTAQQVVDAFRRRVAGMGIAEVVSSPMSPWQSPYVERLIGSIRRECLDHVIVISRTHLRRVLRAYITYYHGARTHLSLEKDAPTPRRAQFVAEGGVIALPEVGGLHHRYERRAA
jgi:putative transposase